MKNEEEKTRSALEKGKKRLENGGNDEVILAAERNSKIEEAEYEELVLLEAEAVKV